SLSFDYYTVPRSAPHPFPTRRSSDLGSGDVLTGLIAALMGQGMAPLDAAVLGVHAHGVAADLWAAERGPAGLLARELSDRLPDRSEEHTSELQSRENLVCRLLPEKKN